MELQSFQGTLDRYNGITVDSQEEPCNNEDFPRTLTNSLKIWSELERRCIWFRVHIKDAAWVPTLANEGFNFHHSRDNFVMMYKWLPTDSSSNLPPACHTSIGVGGIVINDKNELLVVTEKHTDFIHWKLPGGYIERGEDIADAAVREVKEETGIYTYFESMVTLRHFHNGMFGNSDIYLVVKLKPKTDIITKSDQEIAACKWMDIEEYLNHPNVHEFNRFIVKQALDLKERNLTLDLQKTTLVLPKLKREVTCMVIKDL